MDNNELINKQLENFINPENGKTDEQINKEIEESQKNKKLNRIAELRAAADFPTAYAYPKFNPLNDDAFRIIYETGLNNLDKNIGIFGRPHTGKTLLSVMLGKEYIKKFEKSVLFISSSDLLYKVIKDYREGRILYNKCLAADLLIIDSLGIEGKAAIEDTEPLIIRILDNRIHNDKKLWISSFLTKLPYADLINNKLNKLINCRLVLEKEW